MADNSTLDPGAGGDTYRSKDRTGIKTSIVAVDLNPAGAETLMAGVMPVSDNGGSLTVDGTVTATGPLTDTQLRASAVPVSGTVTASGPLTDTQLRATPVPVSGTVTATGPLTDAQLRAVAVPVSGTVTANGAVTNAGTFAVQDSQKVADNAAFTDGTTPVQPAGYVFDEVAGTALTENDAAAARIDSKRAQVTTLEDATTRGQRAAVSAGGALKVDGSAATQPVSGTVTATGPLTDTQLRATPVPVSGTVTTGGLTDAQLRATPVPVSGTVTANLGTANVTNAGTFAVQLAANQSVNNAQVSGTATSVNSGVKDAGTQRVILASDQTVVPVSDNAGSLTVDAPVGTPAFVRLSDGTSAIATLPVSLASLPALAAGTANIGDVDVLTLPALPAGSNNIGDVDVLTLPANATVDIAKVAGTATAVNAGTVSAGVQRVTLASDQTTLTNTIGNVGVVALTTGGLTPSMTISAASTNGTSVKASAGQLYFVMVSNINAAVRYLKFYNKASAPTVGTDTPVQVYAIPGNTAGAGAVIPIPVGLAFATGIAFALTTGVATADTGAVAANEIVVNLGYK